MKTFRFLLSILTALSLAMGLFAALPEGSATADAAGAPPALQAGADRLSSLQNNDGGWDWQLDDGNPATGSA